MLRQCYSRATLHQSYAKTVLQQAYATPEPQLSPKRGLQQSQTPLTPGVARIQLSNKASLAPPPFISSLKTDRPPPPGTLVCPPGHPALDRGDKQRRQKGRDEGFGSDSGQGKVLLSTNGSNCNIQTHSGL
ncbi:unnamed protein product [Arctogadus glacialis]